MDKAKGPSLFNLIATISPTLFAKRKTVNGLVAEKTLVSAA
jgi:hypothetical protein